MSALSTNSQPVSALILIPVFNDWASLRLLLPEIDRSLDEAGIKAKVLVVDDASTLPMDENLAGLAFKAISRVSVLELCRNLGHQRAIAIGLSYVESNLPVGAVIVMDGDGEDTPKDMVKLLEKCEKEDYQKVVFARRAKRSETSMFKFFYWLYTNLYRQLTGREIRVGNFSIIPYKILRRLVSVSEIWNHYAAGLLKARVPYVEIATERGTRLAGKPKMNFVSLVIHGLSAISVFGDTVGVRLIILNSGLIVAVILALIAFIVIRLTTNLAIPGWASNMMALFTVILLQAVLASLFFIFIVLSGRNNSSFLPKRDHVYFVLDIKTIYDQP